MQVLIATARTWRGNGHALTIDAPSHQPRVAEFHALGLEPIRGVSAEHATGAWDLLEELVASLGLGAATADGAAGRVRVSAEAALQSDGPMSLVARSRKR